MFGIDDLTLGADAIDLAGFQPLKSSHCCSWGVAPGCDGLRRWRLDTRYRSWDVASGCDGLRRWRFDK